MVTIQEMRREFIERKLSEQDDYRVRYVAFLDLMGFKSITMEQDCPTIKALFNDIELLKYSFDLPLGTSVFGKGLIEDTDLTIMSDSIIISTEDSYAGLAYLLFLCSTIQSRLLSSKVFPLLVRGGISHGKYFKLDNLSFGPAMTEAYLLEREAIYPRIIVHSNIIEKLKMDGIISKAKKEPIGETEVYSGYDASIGFLLTKRNDDYDFIDYLNPLEILRLSRVCEEDMKNIDFVRQTIINGMNHSEEKVREKYFWLRAYFNQKISCSFSQNLTRYIIPE